MKFRMIPLTIFLLILALGVQGAEAKKQPKYGKYGKYGQAHQLTAEQAALVERAVAREKVLLKNIQQRTPLVETYIQDTKPDVKLYQVPVALGALHQVVAALLFCTALWLTFELHKNTRS